MKESCDQLAMSAGGLGIGAQRPCVRHPGQSKVHPLPFLSHEFCHPGVAPEELSPQLFTALAETKYFCLKHSSSCQPELQSSNSWGEGGGWTHLRSTSLTDTAISQS